MRRSKTRRNSVARAALLAAAAALAFAAPASAGLFFAWPKSPAGAAALNSPGQSDRPRTVGVGEMPGEGQADGWRKNLTSDEQSALDRAGGGNDRVKTYVKLADARLVGAREALGRGDHAAADEQLKAYAALVSDAGRFTKSSVPLRDKAHKTLEQALRVQLRTLEGIRRDTPAEHQELAEVVLATARFVRTQAIDLLVGSGTFLSSPQSASPETPKKSPDSSP
jgi:hypothetical protein